MKIALSLVACWLTAFSSWAATGNGFSLHGVYVTYNGPTGRVDEGRKVAPYIYTLNITGVTGVNGGTLTIKPEQKNPKRVFIDAITCDGPLATLKASFPPGEGYACNIRNINIAGNVKTIQIDGGDLGASDGHDGSVVIAGNLDTLIVNGKSFNFLDSNDVKHVEWWGGNCWADIKVRGAIKKISSKGGNFYFDPVAGGTLGTIAMNGNLDQMFVQGVKAKLSVGSTVTSIFRGGGIDASVLGTSTSVIREIRSQGGFLANGKVRCQRLDKLSIYGQKPGDPLLVPIASQGVFSTYIQAQGRTGDKFDMSSISIKNGNIRDTIVACMGNIKGISLSGPVANDIGLVSNSVFRAGYNGELDAANAQPFIYPNNYSTTVYAGTKMVIPFRFSGQSNELLSTRLHNRGFAIASYISNSLGESFWGPEFWRTSVVDNSYIYGAFVWQTYTNDIGTHSNIIVRTRDNGTPNKYSDFTMTINVQTNVKPVKIRITDENNGVNVTNYTLPVGREFVWKLEVEEHLDQGPIAYDCVGMGAVALGITISNVSSQVAYARMTRAVTAVTFSNILFTANNGVLADSLEMTITLTGALRRAAVELPATSSSDVPLTDEAEWIAIPDPDKDLPGAYEGDIGKFSTVGSVYDTKVVACAADYTPDDWSTADYIGLLKSVNIQGNALNNTLVSLKKINISNADLFSFTGNYVWVERSRITNVFQMK